MSASMSTPMSATMLAIISAQCQPPQCHLNALWGLRDADRMEIRKYHGPTDQRTNGHTSPARKKLEMLAQLIILFFLDSTKYKIVTNLVDFFKSYLLWLYRTLLSIFLFLRISQLCCFWLEDIQAEETFVKMCNGHLNPTQLPFSFSLQKTCKSNCETFTLLNDALHILNFYTW